MIKGIKIHSGYGMGRATVLTSLNQTDFLPQNTVIIAKDFQAIQKAKETIAHATGIVMESEADLHDLQTLAENYAIPAVAGAKDACRQIFDDEPVIVDGVGGVVIVNPDADTEKDYLFLQNNHSML